MKPHGLADLLADRKYGVQRRHRILKDHRDVFAANAPHLAFSQPQQIDLLQENSSPCDASRRLGKKAHRRKRTNGLAGTRLPDDPQHRTRRDGIGKSVDGLHSSGVRLERNVEILNPQRQGREVPC